MIQNPFGILAILIFIEAAVIVPSLHPRFRKFFKFPPAIFWVYFLPMLASNFHIIPQQSVVYPTITTLILPAALILLLVSADIKAVLRLGKPALWVMLTGTAGIMVGAPVVLMILKPWLPPDAWSGFGAISGSWIGGSSNMIAVKEVIDTPDAIYFPMVVVDTIVVYSWMGLLILLEAFQDRYDRWNRSDKLVVEELARRMESMEIIPRKEKDRFLPLILMIGFGGAWIIDQTAKMLGGSFAWTIILASTLGIALSFTPLRKHATHGAVRFGYWLLLLVLASIGARASLSGIFSAPILIVGGFMIVLIQGVFLFTISRVKRIPLCLVATASQANLGGPASAPIVAAAYEPALAPVGLLLGVLGNVVGTYLGILTSVVCKWIS